MGSFFSSVHEEDDTKSTNRKKKEKGKKKKSPDRSDSSLFCLPSENADGQGRS
jgi:hypothetical protein